MITIWHALFSVDAVIAAATAVYGLAALWGAAGRGRWLWRWSWLALLLAALAPIGAYELMVMFGTQAAVIVVGVAGARLVRGLYARRTDLAKAERADIASAWFAQRQFGLGDMLCFVVLMAARFAILRLAAPSTRSLGAAPVDWWLWFCAGAVLGLATLHVAWAVFGGGRWFLRGFACMMACGLGFVATAAAYLICAFAVARDRIVVPRSIDGLERLARVYCLHARCA